VRAKPTCHSRGLPVVRRGAGGPVVRRATPFLLAASLLAIAPNPGRARPAIPSRSRAARPSVLTRLGANADARPYDLVSRAHVAVSRRLFSCVANTEIRLLSIARKAEKGNQLLSRAIAARYVHGLNFAGNSEGRDLCSACGRRRRPDGFHGRTVALKVTAGTIKSPAGRPSRGRSPRRRAEARLSPDQACVAPFRDRLDQDAYVAPYLRASWGSP